MTERGSISASILTEKNKGNKWFSSIGIKWKCSEIAC